MSLVSDDKLRHMQDTIRLERDQDFSATKKKLVAQKVNRNLTRDILLGVVLGLLVVGASMYFAVKRLATQYPKAYHWWNNYRAQTDNPPSKGSVQVTVQSAAVSAMYSGISFAMGLTFMATPLNRHAATFLLSMVSVYGSDLYDDSSNNFFLRGLTDVHWNGSPEQLGYEQRHKFLPPAHQGGIWLPSTQRLNWGYIWKYCWAAPVPGASGSANPWFLRIWPTVEVFMAAPIILDYYRENTVGMDALFRGGLVQYALTMQNSGLTAPEMMHHLVGVTPTTVKAKCTKSQRINAGMNSGMMAGGLGLLVMGAGGPVGAPLFALGSAAVGTIYGMHSAKTADCGSTLEFPDLGASAKTLDELST